MKIKFNYNSKTLMIWTKFSGTMAVLDLLENYESYAPPFSWVVNLTTNVFQRVITEIAAKWHLTKTSWLL